MMHLKSIAILIACLHCIVVYAAQINVTKEQTTLDTPTIPSSAAALLTTDISLETASEMTIETTTMLPEASRSMTPLGDREEEEEEEEEEGAEETTLETSSTPTIVETTPIEMMVTTTSTNDEWSSLSITTKDPPSSSASPSALPPPQKLPPNLQSLSLVLVKGPSSSKTDLPPSSLSYDKLPTGPPTPAPQLPHENSILSNILLLTPHFSSPVSQPSSPSLLAVDLEEEEKEEKLREEVEEKAALPSSSSTAWSPINRSFSFSNRADSILNLTGELGGSVFMPCTTHHSMERQVSWVRRRDWHILTSGTLTYTKEERFSVHHPEGSTDWTLVIKYIQLDDAGTYECQVSTGTGILSRLVELNVVEPNAVIPGNGEYHIDAGSTITLDCYIHQSLVAPQYIFWYHNSRMINYDRERGVNVQIETGPSVRSRLTVKKATPGDSGNYTCAAANSKPAFTTVYITNDNKLAAIQSRARAGESRLHSCLSAVVLLQLLVSFLAHRH